MTFTERRISTRSVIKIFWRTSTVEFALNPQPDSSLSLTKWDELYTLSLIGRWQLNQFQDVTERKPEFVFDFKQQPFFGLPVQYDGSTGVASLRRAFSNSPFKTTPLTIKPNSLTTARAALTPFINGRFPRSSGTGFL